MDTALHTFGNLLPYHLLSYSALLGMEVYQSFINTKICFQVLPPREFIALQKRLFPVYFGCQVGLTALTALTLPPHSIVSLMKDVWSVIPLGIVFVTSSLNSFVFGPRTTTTSLIRRALHENKENAPDYDAASKLQRANRNFSHNHAMTIHLNAIALVATICYGFSLSSSIIAGL